MSERIEEFLEVRRHAERGSRERAEIETILDEAPFCTVSFLDGGRPMAIPTIHVRIGDSVVLHGSPASRMLRILKTGAPCAVAVTILDGLVLARSVFNHSMNYRSVVIHSSGREITDPREKWEAMRLLTEKLVPGRWDDARQPSDKEFKGTMLVALPIDLASAKVRSGPPVDEDEDYDLPVWAGVIPFTMTPGTPQPDPRLPNGTPLPRYLAP